ncbi:hypothetical protein [Singulisphaera sp. PoT]|uniref:hypothetical protein n=1 Tax=Singulisphaera sp. PoT TaxID=3411797 RepID=UPI003BF58862
MTTSYTPRLGLGKPSNNQRGWDDDLNEDWDIVDGSALGSLAVVAVEVPSSSLNVKVSAGTFRKQDGTVGSIAAVSSLAMAASSTNYVYANETGSVTSNTTGFPANTSICRLAVVTTDAGTVTSVVDSRAIMSSMGATLPIYANQSANAVLAGPGSGASAAPTFRPLGFADLPVLAPVTLEDAATITFDPTLGPDQQVTLGGNRTLAIANDAAGSAIEITLKQDATGSRTVTWWPGIRWPGGTAPTLTTAANKEDVFRIEKRGTGNYRGIILGQGF